MNRGIAEMNGMRGVRSGRRETLGDCMTNEELQILRPYIPGEAITTREAALHARKAVTTIRCWCCKYGIGRRMGGHTGVSLPALDMVLEDDHTALGCYLGGDRHSDTVRPYFERHGIKLPG